MLGLSQKISKPFQFRHAARREESAASAQRASSPQPDPEELRRVLTSPEGQALLRLLQADGGAGVRAASAALQGGDVDAAKAALTPLLEGTDAEELTKRIEAQL